MCEWISTLFENDSNISNSFLQQKSTIFFQTRIKNLKLSLKKQQNETTHKTHKNRQFPTDSAITQKHTISHKNKQINTKSNNFPQKQTISNKNIQQNLTKTHNKIQQNPKTHKKTQLRQYAATISLLAVPGNYRNSSLKTV